MTDENFNWQKHIEFMTLKLTTNIGIWPKANPYL